MTQDLIYDATDLPPYYARYAGTESLYAYHLPFSKILAASLDALMDRIKKNKASVILIDGNVGYGKTTFGVHIADYVNIYHGVGEPIDLEIQIGVGGEDFKSKLLLCHEKKLPVIIYDEAGDFDKKTTLSRFNRDLVRIFEMYRGFKILIVFCLPKFYKLENELFESGIPRMLCHIIDRSDKQGTFEVFDLEQMYYIKNYAKKIIVTPRSYSSGRPNFYGHFLDLPEERSRRLNDLSIKAKRREIQKTAVDVRNFFSLAQMVVAVNRTDSYVRSLISQMPNVGEVRRIGQMKYYQKEVLDYIKSRLEKTNKKKKKGGKA